MKTKEEELFEAVKSNDLEKVKEVLDKIDDISHYDYGYQDYPIHIACRNQNLEIVKLLLDKGAKIAPPTFVSSPWENLFLTSKPNIELVKLFIELQSSELELELEFTESLKKVCQGETPDSNLIKLLVEAGGSTSEALSSLCKNPNPDINILEYLVNKGNLGQKSFTEALNVICKNPNPNREIVKYLVNKGARIAIENSGLTPLHLACENGNNELVEYFLSKDNININWSIRPFGTPLEIACKSEKPNEQIIKNLLKAGADPNLVIEWSYKNSKDDVLKLLIKNEKTMPITWFDQGVFKEKNNTEKILNEKGSCTALVVINNVREVNAKNFPNKKNNTTIEKLLLAHTKENSANLIYRIAVMHKMAQRSGLPESLKGPVFQLSELQTHMEEVNKILDKGDGLGLSMTGGSEGGHIVSIQKHDKGYTMFDPNRGNKEITDIKKGIEELFSSYNEKYTQVAISNISENIKYFNLTKDPNSLDNQKNQKYFKITDLGDIGGNINLVNKMIEIEFKNDLEKAKSFITEKSLYKAIIGTREINAEFLTLILENGGSKGINILDATHGNTALHNLCAHPNSNLDIVKLLVNYGGDLTVKTNVGATVLHAACISKNPNLETINYILENKVCSSEINHQDSFGFSAMHYACKNKNIDLKIIKSLIEKGAQLDIYDNEKETPLDKAKNSKNHELVKILSGENKEKIIENLNKAIENKSKLENIKLLFDSDFDNEEIKKIKSKTEKHVVLNNKESANITNIEKIKINRTSSVNDKSWSKN